MILLELVKIRNFNSDKIMLVRHQEPLYNINFLYKNDFIRFNNQKIYQGGLL